MKKFQFYQIAIAGNIDKYLLIYCLSKLHLMVDVFTNIKDIVSSFIT
jgi:hypothetical protein